MEKFTTKEKKKAFDQIFNDKIVPFFAEHGFSRHTKSSKRLFKDFENKLSVYLFFEYKNFGSGFYDTTISYFDEDFGTVMNDEYLVMAKQKISSFSGNNPQELNQAVVYWLEEIQETLIPFIEKHDTHKAILASTNFYISKSREEERLNLLKRKSR